MKFCYKGIYVNNAKELLTHYRNGWINVRYPKKDIDPLKESEYKEEKVIRPYPRKDYLVMEGRLLGGCLDCLVNLCGTKFDKTKEYITNNAFSLN